MSGGWDRTVNIWDLRLARAVRSVAGPYICGGDNLDIRGNEVWLEDVQAEVFQRVHMGRSESCGVRMQGRELGINKRGVMRKSSCGLPGNCILRSVKGLKELSRPLNSVVDALLFPDG